MLALKIMSFGAQLDDVERGDVFYVDGCVGNPGDVLVQDFELVIGELPISQLLAAYPSHASDEACNGLRAAHLPTEDGHSLLVVHSHVAHHTKDERCLPHGRPCRHDYHIAVLPASSKLVQLYKAGRHAAQTVACGSTNPLAGF